MKPPAQPQERAYRALDDIRSHDQVEVLRLRLQREMHEFFEHASMLASSILSQVRERQDSEMDHQVLSEMETFLGESRRRAELLLSRLQSSRAAPGAGGPVVADLEASMGNLSSMDMDRFRAAGSTSTAERHKGMDPRQAPAPAAPADPGPAAQQAHDPPGEGGPPGEGEEDVHDALRLLVERGVLDPSVAEAIKHRPG